MAEKVVLDVSHVPKNVYGKEIMEPPAAYDSALSTSLIASDPDQLIPVVQAKAGYERRKIESREPGQFCP